MAVSRLLVRLPPRPLSGVEPDGARSLTDLLGERGILARDRTAEPVDAADGIDEVI
jgi:hypothetical protein